MFRIISNRYASLASLAILGAVILYCSMTIASADDWMKHENHMREFKTKDPDNAILLKPEGFDWSQARISQPPNMLGNNYVGTHGPIVDPNKAP